MNHNPQKITKDESKRSIKSYICRSRMTTKQREALAIYWPKYGIVDINQPLDFSRIFARNAPTILEIGFGMGNSLIKLAEDNKDMNFIGIEVHRPGIGALMIAIEEQGLSNIRIICADAVQILEQCISSNSLNAVLLFFPDPWPKKRHHKRRIVQPNFLELIYDKLIDHGYFHIATDVSSYALYVQKVVNSHSGFHNTNLEKTRLLNLIRPKTKFELRGEAQGNAIFDFILEKKP